MNLLDKGINLVKLRFNNLVSKKVNVEEVAARDKIYLNAGDVPGIPQYKHYIGLSIRRRDEKHFFHDINNKHPFRDNSVDIYQAEDVMEHIEYGNLPSIINDIYRILKPGGTFRLSIPDYGCDILRERTIKDKEGNLLFDPGGGGIFKDGKVLKGGHVWFPTYKLVREMLAKTTFTEIKFYHYYDDDGKGVTNPIDYSLGFVQRTPDHDPRVQNPYRPLSIVVDCVK